MLSGPSSRAVRRHVTAVKELGSLSYRVLRRLSAFLYLKLSLGGAINIALAATVAGVCLQTLGSSLSHYWRFN